MNQPFSELPAQCEVLVIGAGPAGSAAATVLAGRGIDVVMVDAKSFPRDKICGDALIPDAHAALTELGVLDEVMALAHPAGHVACVGPRGRRVEVPGTLAVLPRRTLDEVLCRHAVRAGVRMFAPARFERLLTAPSHGNEARDRVVGARLVNGERSHELSARWVILATGASAPALTAAGMCLRSTPSGVALRAYVKHGALAAQSDSLDIVWHKRFHGGYGWLFPGPDGVFNIGVGVADMHRLGAESGRGSKQDVNLRTLFDEFCRVYAPAQAVMSGGTVVGVAKGAPLRVSLQGATLSRPGLLVTGEAAGSTYAFTGEGIGKAMETAMLAAKAVAQHAQSDAEVQSTYQDGINALRPRFQLYERAGRVNAFPWVIDLLLWRASKSERILRRMGGVLNETSNPGNLFSAKGLWRLFAE